MPAVSRTFRRRGTLAGVVMAACSLAACGDNAQQTVEEGSGDKPKLPEPRTSWLPTVNVATAKGWPAGVTPQPAEGLIVSALATGLDHPRWLYVLPNGDVLVAETNAPVRPADNPGIRNWAMGLLKKRAGAGVTSADRITLLRGLDAKGQSATRTEFLTGLNSPFGMALIGSDLYVANTDAIIKFPYKEGDTKITSKGTKLVDLPAGDINHHWTKNIVASKDGKYLYASVGSNSNVAENGIENEKDRAAVWEIETATGKSRVFASGLRNPVGMAWQPQSGALWVAVNERDELGSDLVPDYMTALKEGGFYGWPYSYYGQHVDSRVTPQKPDLVATAIPPDYALGPHTASLGLTFDDNAAQLPPEFNGGAFVGQHGSWNRKPHSGYRVIFVPFADGRPSGAAREIITGFLDADGNALGRPVGVTIDKAGALLVADDVGNAIWRVTASAGKSAKLD